MKYVPATSRQNGFTLVETMIAVTILTLAVAGPLMSANAALVAAETARDQLTASYIAQEGIEYVRAMRDNEFLLAYSEGGSEVSAVAWNYFLTNQSPPDTNAITQCIISKCTLDPAAGTASPLSPCPGNSCTEPLYLLPSGVYSQRTDVSGSVRQPFIRYIQATRISDTDERIVSTVTWTFHSTNYRVTVSDDLTPWQ